MNHSSILKGNKEIYFVFAKAINPQVEATWSSLRLLVDWVMLSWMPWHRFRKKISNVVEQTDGNAPGESALSPMPTVRSLIYSSVSNGKCVQAGKGRSPWQQVQLLPLERKLETIWTLLTGSGMSAKLGNLPRLCLAMIGRDRGRVLHDFSAPQWQRWTLLHWKYQLAKKVSDAGSQAKPILHNILFFFDTPVYHLKE